MDKPYNRIVLIGNGFDKALGLKTGYEDFMVALYKEMFLTALKNNKFENSLISINIEGENNDYIRWDREALIKKLENLKDFIEFENHNIRLRFKSHFFELLTKYYSEARWVDIEHFYYEYLLSEFDHFKLGGKFDTVPKTVIELNQCMDYLTAKLNNYIQNEQDKNPIDYLNSHLYSLFDCFNDPLVPNRSRIIYKREVKQPPENIFFLNFNYTDTIKNFINHTTWGNTKVQNINIHGRVNSDLNPIIFGYGDDTGDKYKRLEDEGENEWLRKIKSFQYPRTIYYHTILNFLEFNEFEVFIVGHSCGLSDRTLLKTIFEHENCLGIQNYHYRGEPEDFNKRIQISRHFSDKALMRKRVLPFDKHASIPQHF